MKKLRVCHLSTVHSAFDVRIFHKQCRALSAAGYAVDLVARCDGDNDAHGVRIHGLPAAGSRFARMTATIWKAFRVAVKLDARIYHFHDAELIVVGLLLKLLGKTVIYDVHEDVPSAIVNRTWIPRLLRFPFALCCRIAEGIGAVFFDAVITATRAIAGKFPQHKTSVVQNYPILHELVQPNQTPYQERPSHIAYVGGITQVRGIREMVQALSLVPTERDIRFVVAGAFEPAGLLREIKNISGWERVDFVGWKSRPDVSRLLDTCRAGLLLFHAVPNHIDAQPNKLFEYMSAGIPVVVSDFPLWREIVAGAQCGLLVDPLDTRAIAEAVTWIIEHPAEAEEMGRRGRHAVRDKYNWSLESHKLLDVYKRLTDDVG